VPRKKINKPDYWDDLSVRLSEVDKLASQFFSEAEGIPGIRDVAASELKLSDEPNDEGETVSVRFGDDYEDATDEPGSKPLDLMPQKHKQGATEWAQLFAEMIARVQEFSEHSRLNVIRWVHHGTGKKVSFLPSVVDFLADVDLIAKRSLNPVLYRVFHEIYFESYGEGADRVPEVVQIYIQTICVAGWKKAGLLPFRMYWSKPTPEDKLGESVNLMEVIQREQRREQQHADSKARRKVLRKARRDNRKRNAGVRTLAVAA
jgi:hypothetical protein